MRRRGASVRWSDFLAWAKEHGAQNDRIDSCRITAMRRFGVLDYVVVNMTGFAENAEGRPYLSGEDEAARWESTSILRRLP